MGMTKRSVPVIYGEVLYDCFPDGGRVLGGAPFNMAWHCQAFGMKPLFISRVGNDQPGEQIKDAMRRWDMNLAGLQVDETRPTGVVDIRFIDDEPAYDIVTDSAWDFISLEDLPVFEEVTMLYHGSLVLRSDVSAATLRHIKKSTRPSVFVDVNLRAPWWDISEVDEAISDCRWLKLNEDELGIITSKSASIEDNMKKLLNIGALDLLVVTRGEKGAMVADAQGVVDHVSPEPALQVVDTVGAGDAFSSVLLLGQSSNWPLHTTLHRAQQFASAIVGIQGATISDKEFYQPFIDGWQLAD